MRFSGMSAAALLLLLAGCVPPTAPVTPTTAPASSPPVTSAEPSSPSASPSTGDGYQPLPMPAADGRPMLWPTIGTEWVMDEGWQEALRFGFVDVTGTVVAAQQYDSYLYCTDDTGRPVHVLATSADRTDVLDLNGDLLASLKAGAPLCAGADHVIVRDSIDAELGHFRAGIVRLSTGETVLKPKNYRDIQVVDPTTVNVAEKNGKEYFLDLATGTTTPHPGWVMDAVREPGAPGVLAAEHRPDDEDEVGGYGFLGMDGGWVVPPTLQAAERFTGGYAPIRQDGRWTFLDAGLKPTGGDWDEISSVGIEAFGEFHALGYEVSRDGRHGLLGADLRTLVEPDGTRVDCPWDARGVCSVTDPSGRVSLVWLLDGRSVQLPDGLTDVLNTSLAVAVASSDDLAARQVYSVRTGASFVPPEGSICQAVGDHYAQCWREGSPYPVAVVDAAANPTLFREATATDDADPLAPTPYYWVVSGSYRGFVDAGGRWHYRESRFTQLED